MPTKLAQRRMKICNPPTSPFRKGGTSKIPLFFKEGFGEITENSNFNKSVVFSEQTLRKKVRQMIINFSSGEVICELYILPFA